MPTAEVGRVASAAAVVEKAHEVSGSSGQVEPDDDPAPVVRGPVACQLAVYASEEAGSLEE